MTERRWDDQHLAAALLVPRSDEEANSHAFANDDVIWELASGQIDAERMERILDHVAVCPDCFLALRVARATIAEPAVDRPAGVPPLLSTIRGSLVATVLHPIAAVIYLGLLLASLTFQRAWRVSPTVLHEEPAVIAQSLPPAGLRAVRMLPVTGDRRLRSAEATSPTRVPLEGNEALVLKLFPEVRDLPKDPRAPLTIRVLTEGSVVATANRNTGDLETDESFSLLLDSGLLRTGVTYRVELMAGSATPLLQQSFRVEPR